MREEILRKLKDRLKQEKIKNENHNLKVEKIKELENDPKVREYLNLTESKHSSLKPIELTDERIVSSFYRSYLSEIKENETNGIYVYVGTYSYSKEANIVHDSDERVNYSDPNANYRIYFDIEQLCSQNIPISECEQFEKNHIVINPKTYLKEQEYYKIQKQFFIKAVMTNQEAAKKLVLGKYPRMNK